MLPVVSREAFPGAHRWATSKEERLRRVTAAGATERMIASGRVPGGRHYSTITLPHCPMHRPEINWECPCMLHRYK